MTAAPHFPDYETDVAARKRDGPSLWQYDNDAPKPETKMERDARTIYELREALAHETSCVHSAVSTILELRTELAAANELIAELQSENAALRGLWGE